MSRGGFSHGSEAVEGRRLGALDEAVQRLHRLQLRHHLVQQALGPRPSQVQHHAFSLCYKKITVFKKHYQAVLRSLVYYSTAKQKYPSLHFLILYFKPFHTNSVRREILEKLHLELGF